MFMKVPSMNKYVWVFLIVLLWPSFLSAQHELMATISSNDGLLNVKAFGARGNGVTDDTAAIRAAVATIPSGGVLVFPPGVYRVSSTLDLSSKSAFMLLGSSTRSGGAAGTTIIGSVAADLVKSVGATSFLIRGINFQNTSP